MKSQTSKYRVPYSHTEIEFSLPPTMRGTVVVSRSPDPLVDVDEAIRKALAHPIGSPPLRQLVQGRRSACIVISDITGSQMNLLWRTPKRSPLLPRSEYERKVVEARRRRLVYPYEIIRMLTGGGRGTDGGSQRAGLPAGRFEEYDLDPDARSPVPRVMRNLPLTATSSRLLLLTTTRRSNGWKTRSTR